MVYYDDDGVSYDYQDGKYTTLTIQVQKTDKEYQIHCEKQEQNGFTLAVKQLDCEIYDAAGNAFKTSAQV